MTIEQISDIAKQLKKKYDETDPEKLAGQMKILVSREPMGLFEGCCKGFFLIHRRKKHITINGDLPDVLQRVVLAHVDILVREYRCSGGTDTVSPGL